MTTSFAPSLFLSFFIISHLDCVFGHQQHTLQIQCLLPYSTVTVFWGLRIAFPRESHFPLPFARGTLVHFPHYSVENSNMHASSRKRKREDGRTPRSDTSFVPFSPSVRRRKGKRKSSAFFPRSLLFSIPHNWAVVCLPCAITNGEFMCSGGGGGSSYFSSVRQKGGDSANSVLPLSEGRNRRRKKRFFLLLLQTMFSLKIHSIGPDDRGKGLACGGRGGTIDHNRP